jgi:uncharacterized protein YodC (DUF2158 family)
MLERAKTMTSRFKIGDEVMLKAGGQKMTVIGVGDLKGVPHVWCAWHTKDGNEKTNPYPEDALMLVSDKRPPTVNRGPPGGKTAAARRKGMSGEK